MPFLWREVWLSPKLFLLRGGLVASLVGGRSLTCLFIVARALSLFLVLGWDVVELRQYIGPFSIVL